MTFEELQAINYHWRLAIDQLDEGILILRGGIEDLTQVRIVFANAAVERHLGMEEGTLVTLSLGDVLLEDQCQRFQSDWLASDPQMLFRGCYALKMPSGGILEADWLISSRTGSLDGEPDHTATLRWRPVSDAESPSGEDREFSGEHALELNKADTIAHIARGIVHDFNNSLTAIRGHLEVAMPDTPEGSALQVALEQAMEAAVTTSQLCQRLLHYAKGRHSVKRACSVHEVVHQAVAITGLGSNVTCEQRIPPEVWPIQADGIQIVQVINNLLMNAQQAMPRGGTIVVMAKNVPLDSHSAFGLPPGNYVVLTVRDRGVGIAPDQRERIFEALYTTKPNGSGLGLATCAQIISGHQGYIDVHSAPNRGSEFIVYIPAALDVPGEGREKEHLMDGLESDEGPAGPAPYAPQLKILVVEDQAGISRIAQVYLEQLGHVVVCATTGEEAVAAYREAWREGDCFDLSIIDLTLPGGMDGEDTFRELRRIDPHTIGIATSGSMDRDAEAFYQRKGFASILPKPYPLKMLSDVVQEAMLFHTV